MSAELPQNLIRVLEQMRSTQMVNFWIGAGAPNYKDWMHDEIYRAAQVGNLLTITRLLPDHFSPNSFIDRRPLIAASTKGHEDVVRFVLDAGANPEMGDELGNTPLHHAALKGHLRIVQLLLQHGADPTIENKRGATALDAALNNEHIKIVELLHK